MGEQGGEGGWSRAPAQEGTCHSREGGDDSRTFCPRHGWGLRRLHSGRSCQYSAASAVCFNIHKCERYVQSAAQRSCYCARRRQNTPVTAWQLLKSWRCSFFALTETFPLWERGKVARRQFVRTLIRRAGQVWQRGGVSLKSQIIWCRRGLELHKGLAAKRLKSFSQRWLYWHLQSACFLQHANDFRPQQLWFVPLWGGWQHRKQGRFGLERTKSTLP